MSEYAGRSSPSICIAGFGDYLNDDAVNDIGDYVMPVPVHELATAEQFLLQLDGHETVSPAGEHL